jgi:hypothetical protein
MPDAARDDVASAVRATVSAVTGAAAASQAAALSGVAASQAALAAQLDALDAEMTRVAAVVEDLSLDPANSRHMAEARDSLARSRTRLVGVRGRLGRLRGLEESQRLRGVARPETEMRLVGAAVGHSPPPPPDADGAVPEAEERDGPGRDPAR